MEVTTGVEVADVAGMQPAVDDRFRGLGRVLVIALHYQIAADADLARFALRQDTVVVVKDLDSDQGIGPSHRRKPLVAGQRTGVEMLVGA